MNFRKQGRPLSASGMERCCDALAVSAAEVWALLTVETRGFGFLRDRRPQILFERHVFRKLTQGRYDRSHADISNARAGGYAGEAAEYPRLARAMRLDEAAALESASWGIGQVMGFNCKAAGYAGVREMVAAMVEDEDAQLLAMANFIRSRRLEQALRRHDWATFARGYNGAQYRNNQYHLRLAAAHAKHAVALPDLELRSAQAALCYLGFDPGPVDGFSGRRTRAALAQFQAQSGLRETGALGRTCANRLRALAFAE